MATAPKKTPRAGVQEARQGAIAAPAGGAPARVAIVPQASRPGHHDHAYGPADPHARPFLTAAQSHLDLPPNPKPEWPSTQGLYGTGAISLLARLDDALDKRSRAAAEGVDTMHAPPQVGAYKAEVLEWLRREGL